MSEERLMFKLDFYDAMFDKIQLLRSKGKGVIVFPEGDLLDDFYSNDKIKEDEVYILLAKKIIDAHSGQVEVESVKGVGSTIKITLPVAQ